MNTSLSTADLVARLRLKHDGLFHNSPHNGPCARCSIANALEANAARKKALLALYDDYASKSQLIRPREIVAILAEEKPLTDSDRLDRIEAGAPLSVKLRQIVELAEVREMAADELVRRLDRLEQKDDMGLRWYSSADLQTELQRRIKNGEKL